MRIRALLLLVVFGAVAWIWLKKPSSKQESFSYPVVEKKPFVIVVPTFNDSVAIEHTLFSIFQQNYDNYRLLLIDDHSIDDTVEKAQKCIRYFNAQDRTTFIRQDRSSGVLGCLYNGIHSCHDQEVVVVLLGGDRLGSPQVLDRLNRSYANPNTWMTYGTALEYPSFNKMEPLVKRISDKILSNQLLRKSPWTCGLPITFYATLFKELPIGSLFYRGQFYAMGWEFAIGMPLLEMAAGHLDAIFDPLYLADQTSNKRDADINLPFLQSCERHIRNRAPFYPIAQLVNQPVFSEEKADVVVFSNDRPLQLFALLESIDRHVIGVDKLMVYYCSSSQPIEKGYLEVQRAFPQATFVGYSDCLKSELMSRVFSPRFSSSPYIVLVKDGVIVSDLIHLSRAIQSLESSKAYGVYFDMHQKLTYSAEMGRFQPIPPSTSVGGISSYEALRAWQLSKGRDDWSNRGSLHFALFRKADLAVPLGMGDFSNPQQLLYAWNLSSGSEIGLFHFYPKVISLKREEDTVGQLEKFLSGLKIDLSPYVKLQSMSREVVIDASFVPRD